jgi:N-acetylneuraminic acid mutarotase
MKKIIVLAFVAIAGLKIQAQPYVNIPDPVFRHILDSIVPGAIVGVTLNTTHPGLATVSYLDMNSAGVSDITGVEYLSNLFSLTMPNNQLTFLPALPSNLSTLWVGNNHLTSIPSLLNSSITDLRIGYNPLTLMPVLPFYLAYLDISGLGLTVLPPLPSNLYVLYCRDNQLQSLPALPANLGVLDCSNNQISWLPTLPASLSALSASGNQNLWCLPNLPSNVNFSSDIGYAICPVQGTADSWYKMADFPGPQRVMATAFSIGAKGYLTTGNTFNYLNDLWEYDPATNSWTQKANLPGNSRISAFSFSISRKGYVGAGQGTSPVALNDFWEYDQATNLWTQKANYPGSGYAGNAAFSIGDKGYAGCGIGPGYTFPVGFYEYNPRTNAWTAKANFIGLGRREAACFTIGNRGYVCAGDGSNALVNTSYAYNPSGNSWSAVASTPANLNEAASFSINNKGYVACGQYYFWNGSIVSLLYEYDADLNSWTMRSPVPTLGRFRTAGFAAGGRAYITGGEILTNLGGTTTINDTWEYTPICSSPAGTVYASGSTTICNGDSVMLFAATGNSYQWKKNGAAISGATQYFYYVKSSGNYKCQVTNSCGTVLSALTVVTVNPSPAPVISTTGSAAFCDGDSVLLSVSPGGISYSWKRNNIVINNASANSYYAKTQGYYKVIKTNTYGCSGTTSPKLITVNALPAAAITPQGPTSFCNGDSVTLAANTGVGLTYQWKKNNGNIPGATAALYIAKTQGSYKLKVTNVNGCTMLSAIVSVTVPCRSENNLLADDDKNAPFKITVFPNPSTGIITIQLPEFSPAFHVSLLDITGRLVAEFDITGSQAELALGSYEKGIYYLVIDSGENRSAAKIILTE